MAYLSHNNEYRVHAQLGLEGGGLSLCILRSQLKIVIFHNSCSCVAICVSDKTAKVARWLSARQAVKRSRVRIKTDAVHFPLISICI